MIQRPDVHGSADADGEGPDLLPVRMLNEYAYCPRLFHLMHVEGRWADNAYTVEGRNVHRRADRIDHVLPDETCLLHKRGDNGDETETKVRQFFPPRDEGLPFYVQEQGATVCKTAKTLVVWKQKEKLATVRSATGQTDRLGQDCRSANVSSP